MRTLFSLLLIALFFVSPLSAQDVTVLEDDSWCEESKHYDRNRERHCEVREITLSPDRDVIRVDASQNGGIYIEGWDRNEILIRAKVEASARTRRTAEKMAADVTIETGRTIESDYPGKDSNRWKNKEWVSVSYRIYAPRESNVDVETFNGGVKLANLYGDISFDALNGGVSLMDLAGDVRGNTTNGGLYIELAGDSWEGDRLDVSTTNGGVELVVDEDYSARLEVGTTNGKVNFDFPVMVKGNLDKNISTTLGDGGNLIRARTTNGGVRVKQK